MARTQRSIQERISEKEIQYEQVMENSSKKQRNARNVPICCARLEEPWKRYWIVRWWRKM